MSKELTSQSRGGVYYDLGDGRGAVHETDLTRADRKRLGLEVPDERKQEVPTGEVSNG